MNFFWDRLDADKPRDQHNVYHMLDRHNVTVDKVEEVFESLPLILDGRYEEDGNPLYVVIGYIVFG